MQRSWTRWPLRSPSNSNDSMILFYETEQLRQWYLLKNSFVNLVCRNISNHSCSGVLHASLNSVQNLSFGGYEAPKSRSSGCSSAFPSSPIPSLWMTWLIDLLKDDFKEHLLNRNGSRDSRINMESDFPFISVLNYVELLFSSTWRIQRDPAFLSSSFCKHFLFKYFHKILVPFQSL